MSASPPGPPAPAARTPLVRSHLFWVGVLYFAEGFPLGVFYEIFPVWFRQQGVELRQIGAMSLLGLAWTLKFLWAPAVDHWRGHRRWMAAVDVAMGLAMLYFAAGAGLGPLTWVAIGVFTVLSATNDVAIDGYTIELLEPREMGLANGVRIGMYRVGMLASGFVLVLSDYVRWQGAFVAAAAIFFVLAAVCLAAPRERDIVSASTGTAAAEWRAIRRSPRASAAVIGLLLGTLWLVDATAKWSERVPAFWAWAIGCGLVAWAALVLTGRAARGGTPASGASAQPAEQGPMFGALLELLGRPGILPVLLFILVFKLGDSSMGFMVKPFWVDSGFTATDIGLVSVNIGLGLSILGGLIGGAITDRLGIFRGLWMLGLLQALSNVGYWIAALILPQAGPGAAVLLEHRLLLYAASAFESLTGGMGTAAFLAFLMAITRKSRAATEYALLSSVFALSRSVAGWVGGFGAQAMGYADWFLLTVFLSFPAYALLPWVRAMLAPEPPAGRVDAAHGTRDR